MRASALLLGLSLVPMVASAQAAPNLTLDVLAIPSSGVAGQRLAVQFEVLVSGGVRTPFSWAAHLSTTGALTGARALGTFGPVTPTADGRLRVTGDVTLPTDVGGSYFVVVQLDPANAVNDANAFDDLLSSDARVRITPQAADLRVLTVQPLTTRGRVGDPARVRAEIINVGTVRADVAVVALIDRDGTPSTSDRTLAEGTVSLAPGARQTLELVGTIPAGLQPGAHVVAVLADPTRVLDEVDESDNLAIATAPLVVFEDRLELTTTSIPDGTVFQRYFARLTSSGGDGNYQYTVTRGRLPAGLTLGTASGDITGAPLASGPFEATIEVRSDTRVAERVFTLDVAESGVELTVVTPDLPRGTLGLPYAAELAAAGGEPPYRWTLLSGGAAPGLDLGTDGRIAGVPTEEGSYGFTAEVSDALGGRVRSSFVIEVDPANVLITTLEPAPVPVGEPASITLSVKGGGAPYEWAALSTPPPGLTLSEDGVFSGTPARVGRYTTRVQVTDGTERGHTDTALVIIEVIDAGEFALVVPEIPRLLLREPMSVTLTVQGGKPPYTWRVDPRDEIPAGFQLIPAELGEGEAVLAGASIRSIDKAFLLEVTDKTGRVRGAIVAIHVDAAESTVSSSCACATAPSPRAPLLALVGVALAGLVLVVRRRQR